MKAENRLSLRSVNESKVALIRLCTQLFGNTIGTEIQMPIGQKFSKSRFFDDWIYMAVIEPFIICKVNIQNLEKLF